jgi:hypothetical protein
MSERRLGRSKYALATAFLLVAVCLLLVPNPQPLAMGEGGGVQVTITMTGGSGAGGGGFIPPAECPAGEVSTTGRVTPGGVATTLFTVTSFDGRFRLTIDEGTTTLTPHGECPRCIGIHEMTQPPSPPEGAYIIGVMYDVVPDEATFIPPATLRYSYDPAAIPEGISEESLVIAGYDEASGEWIELDGVVDTEANTITAKVSRIYDFAVFGYKATVPVPAAFECSLLTISPPEVDIGETVNVTILVANTGGQSGIYQVILKINGVAEADREVAVIAGASEQVSFSIARDTAGTYSVDVNGLTGAFVVKEKPVSPVTPVEPTPAKPINWWLIGGIIAAVAIVAFILFLLRRRMLF